ncbi:MAG: hypothetical protein QF437_27200, partial [Planctomycetota bacterium]|nr:hypothetical protein [Planctomycetota bacterium]
MAVRQSAIALFLFIAVGGTVSAVTVSGIVSAVVTILRRSFRGVSVGLFFMVLWHRVGVNVGLFFMVLWHRVGVNVGLFFMVLRHRVRCVCL